MVLLKKKKNSDYKEEAFIGFSVKNLESWTCVSPCPEGQVSLLRMAQKARKPDMSVRKAGDSRL